MADLRFGVLGPVAAWRGSTGLDLGAGKLRSVLAVLLLHANEHVDRERIIDFVWAAAAPKSAVNLVQKYVGELRRILRPDDRILVSAGRAYSLLVRPGQLDSWRFGELVAEGQSARGRGETAVAERCLGEALALWRGLAFGGISAPPAVTEQARLEEYRAGAAEELVEILLSRGGNAAAAAELARLTAEHPFRERLRELQMLALYRSGRRADALAVYRDVRRVLAEELGTDPGPALRRLHEQVLDADPAALEILPVCQLPPDVPDFVGRTEALSEVVSSPFTAVTGGPGTGKTALAVRAAYSMRQRFPDGQLYLDLAGTGPAPREPGAMLAELLRALGVTAIPVGLHERVALYRSRLAGRRMLVVLDDAAGAGQIVPLLPGAGGCGVIVTSRRRLPDLTGARRVELDVFSAGESRRLLAAIVGEDRVAENPACTEDILRWCDHLPLAVRIAGAKLAGRRAWSLRVLRDRLSDESRRLSELRAGDLSVRAGFDLSVRRLTPEAAQAFRLLGLLGPGPHSGRLVGVLLGRRDAHGVLETLVDAGLVLLAGTDSLGQPRFRLRELFRIYAAESARNDPAEVRGAAVRRLAAAGSRFGDPAA